MSMKKDTTNPSSLHALREEFRKARLTKRTTTVNVEDVIFTRLTHAAEMLTVATSLFCELSEDQDNWLLNYRDDIVSARSTLNEVVGKGVAHGLLL